MVSFEQKEIHAPGILSLLSHRTCLIAGTII